MNILAMETMSAVKTVRREIITATVPRGKTFAVHMVNFRLPFHKTETAPLSHRL